MSKKRENPPHVQDVVALLAGAAPVSSMLLKGVKAQQLKHTASVREVAAILNTQPFKVRRIGKAYRHGGMDAALGLKWGAGRPLKQMNFQEGDIERMVSVPTLYEQAGMNIEARAQQISQELGQELKASELRKLYAGRGITK